MIVLQNRTVDDYGNVYFKVKDLYSLILKGYDVSEFKVELGPEYEKLKQTANELDETELVPPQYVRPTEPLDFVMDQYRTNWLIPARYKTLNLRDWLLQLCSDQKEKDRVLDELAVFEKYELFDMLRSLVYLIDLFRKHKLLWGIGRGSSVSSFVLFLIGVHRVNSLEYDLDFSEFLN